MQKIQSGLCFIFMLITVSLAAENALDEAWLEDDSEWRALQVNEGQLKFLEAEQLSTILHSDTQLWITDDSVRNGWVKMQQCYRHLDAVGRTDVVYAYTEMRNLEIIRSDKISQASIKHNLIELEDVEQGAELCVKSEVKILHCLSSNICSIKNGPYHRKFLDGYYPYHVSLRVNYPQHYLQFESSEPGGQKGFNVQAFSDRVEIESWFEGELMITLLFSNTYKLIQ